IEHDRALVSSVWCGRLPWRGRAAYYISDERPPTGRAASLLPFGAAHLDAVVRVLRRPNDQALRTLNLRSMPTLSSTRTETLRALQQRKPKMPASKPRKYEERETRQAVIEDARPRARIAISF